MSNILSTGLAAKTFAQIVDGLPTRDIYREWYSWYRDDFNNNVEASQRAMEVVDACREGFSAGDLHVDAKVCILHNLSLTAAG